MNKKMIILATAAALAFFAFAPKKENGNGCVGGYFLVNNSPVCAELLEPMGFLYWRDGALGSGWYYWDDFVNDFGIADNLYKQSLLTLGRHTVDITSTVSATSGEYLASHFKTDAGMLQPA